MRQSQNSAKPDFPEPTFVDHALALADRGWAVFPITAGEVSPPLVKWGTDYSTDETVIRRWGAKWPDANVGIACGPSGLCVVDLDLKGGKNGRKELDKLEVFHGDLPATLTARTPSGGYHIYLNGEARTTVDLGGGYPGIDTRSGGGQGGYVLGPGSKTAVGAYAWETDPRTEVAELPDWFKELAGRRPDRAHTDEAAVEPDQPHNIEWAVHYLKEDAKPAVEGQGGNDTTFRVACILRDKGISETLCARLMAEHYNRRCQPPWGDDELERVVENAYQYASIMPLGGDTAEADFDDDPPDVGGAAVGQKPSPPLERFKDGRPKPTLKNCMLLVEWIGMGLAFDELSQRPVLLADPLPWARDIGRELNEDVLRVIRHLMMFYHHKVEFPKDHVTEACLTLAREAPFNPVASYLDGLMWDGRPRLDRWLTDYLGAADDAYTSVVGRKTLVAAVRRARRPGCKFDTVLILEGMQGSGKSRAVRALAGEWFSDAELGRLDGKDAPMQLQGTWIHELGELATLNRGEVEHLKAFVVRQEDRYRAPYERLPRTLPRRCIFIGTTNAEAYLTDSTGNRRFWPVRTTIIKIDRLGQDRDQLWAEAAMVEASGEQLELPPNLWPEAKDEQADRLVVDPWEDQVRHWLQDSYNGDQIDRIFTRDLLSGALGLQAGQQSQHHGKRLRKVMSSLGYEYKRTLRIGEIVGNGYVLRL